MEKQLTFNFIKDYPNKKDDINKYMEEIAEDAKAEFQKLLDKYEVNTEDRKSIYIYANHH